jgi:beta-lactamase class A
MISYKPLLPLLAVLFLGKSAAKAQGQLMSDSLTQITHSIDGLLGVAITDVRSGETTLLHGHDHQPMMSVFKFPLALYILDQADKGKLSLDEPFIIRKASWKMYSPLLNRYPGDTVRLTLRDLTANIILLSDNVACDVLLQRIGGPRVLNDYVHGLGIKEINIAYTETQMADDPQRVYDNWCTPAAMNILLQRFYEHHILSDTGTGQLLQWMIQSTPYPHRLKGLLPPDIVVAHKPGTSNTDSTGLTAATNDVGILTLPGGAHLYVTVFLANSHADLATREHAIALVGRLAASSKY